MQRFERWLRGAVAVVATGAAGLAAAVPITFTHTGTGSGSLNGVNFTNAAFTINDTGDTATRVSFSGGFSIDTVATIAIAGFGTVTFITPTRTFVGNSTSTVGLARGGGVDLFDGPTNAGVRRRHDAEHLPGPRGRDRRSGARGRGARRGGPRRLRAGAPPASLTTRWTATRRGASP